ncbi:MAG: hypothetical protein H0T39_03065 [Actinobacteria bacterium]|nr:hypothetical protein [Actinomycetota bacterium]
MLTRVVLLATLAGTALAVTDVLRRSELEPRTAALYLLLFTLLFFVRVAGQLLVWRRSPGWLPPMREWNLVPYPVLLPIQLVFLATMTALAATLEPVDPRPSFGRALIGLAVLYAAAMVVRYAVRMVRRPDARWFGGAIPIVFHLVLAAYLLTWGSYHVSD